MATCVAVDAMGGDHAPEVVVEGAVRAAHETEGLKLLLVGPRARIEEVLQAQEEAASLPIQVIDAPEVIGMGEAPTTAVKRKRRSSIHVGLQMLKEGQADAFASAGNTGAIMTAALFILGRLPGVERPSVIGYVPTTESSCVLLDVGTNVDCKPEHLAQFGRMGAVYVEQILKRPNPTVALLNIGEEPGKGNEQVQAAYQEMSALPELNFRGNIEGRDMFSHAADVVVCDGFVGNIILKMGESMGTTLLSHLVEKEVKRQELAPEEQRLIKKIMTGIQKPFDYEEHGGVPLLGVSGNVMIGHGSSSVRAIKRMILSAAEVAAQDVAGAIAEAFKEEAGT